MIFYIIPKHKKTNSEVTAQNLVGIDNINYVKILWKCTKCSILKYEQLYN